MGKSNVYVLVQKLYGNALEKNKGRDFTVALTHISVSYVQKYAEEIGIKVSFEEAVEAMNIYNDKEVLSEEEIAHERDFNRLLAYIYLVSEERAKRYNAGTTLLSLDSIHRSAAELGLLSLSYNDALKVYEIVNREIIDAQKIEHGVTPENEEYYLLISRLILMKESRPANLDAGTTLLSLHTIEQVVAELGLTSLKYDDILKAFEEINHGLLAEKENVQTR